MPGLLPGGQFGQKKFGFYSQDGIPGQIFGLGDHVAMPHLNRANHIQQVQTITPPADAAISEGDRFWLYFDGEVISHTVPAGGDTRLATGLAIYAFLRMSGNVRNMFEDITSNGSTGVITLTAAQANTSVPVMQVDASGIPVASPDFAIAETTAPGAGIEIGFGLFVGLPTVDIPLQKPASIHEMASVQSATLLGSTNPNDFTVLGITMNPSTIQSVGVFDLARDVFLPGRTMPVLQDIGNRQGIYVQSTDNFNVGATNLYANADGRLTPTATNNFDLSGRVSVVGPSTVHNPRIGTPQLITPVSFRR